MTEHSDRSRTGAIFSLGVPAAEFGLHTQRSKKRSRCPVTLDSFGWKLAPRRERDREEDFVDRAHRFEKVAGVPQQREGWS